MFKYLVTLNKYYSYTKNYKMANTKDFSLITKLLIGLPTQLVISDKSLTFTANTKTLKDGTVIKAPIVNEILSADNYNFEITEKKVGKAKSHYEYINGKSQDTIWQMVKYTIK